MLKLTKSLSTLAFAVLLAAAFSAPATAQSVSKDLAADSVLVQIQNAESFAPA